MSKVIRQIADVEKLMRRAFVFFVLRTWQQLGVGKSENVLNYSHVDNL